MKTVAYTNGDTMPLLGLGTWKSEPDEVRVAVNEALEIGYRQIDCASIYQNEAEVGQALAEAFREGIVSREELWVTSKLWNDRHAEEDVVPALESTLADLQLDSLDLYLMHWPVALKKGTLRPESGADFIPLADLPITTTWRGMERAKSQGLCRHIGVSNFSSKKLKTLLDAAKFPPELNQVELHPYLQQRGLVSFCQEHQIHVTAYSPLGSRDRPDSLKQAGEPVLLEDPTITGIAERRNWTPGQVLISWGIQRGTAVIPKSVSRQHLQDNFAAADLRLSAEEMQAIAEMDRHRRYVKGDFWATEGSPYTVAELWDE